MAAALRGAFFCSGARCRCSIISSLNPCILPFQLISSRGIASKLFVGGMITDTLQRTENVGLSRLAISGWGQRFSTLLGLSSYMSEDTLAEAFSKFGQVVEARLVLDSVSDRPKGFGFVTFASEDEAQNALKQMNGKVLNGRVIFVDIAKAKSTYAFPIPRGPPNPPNSE